MKFILSIGLMFFNISVFGNAIDSLKTDKQVELFIQKLYIQKYPNAYDNKQYTFSLNKPDSVNFEIACDSLIRTWDLKKWWKIDFNQDNHSDLFAIIYIRNINDSGANFRICAIIDNGDNNFDLNEIPNFFFFGCYAATPIFINKKPLLLFRSHKTQDSLFKPIDGSIPSIEDLRYYDVAKTDTLIYKYGGFIEINNYSSDKKQIESIYFEVGPCAGACPTFKINIYKDGSAFYIKDETLTESGGNFRGTVDKKHLNEIIALIHYININSLNDNYSVTSLHWSTTKLSIYFSDGSVKKIEDYGLQGTHGLVRLYALLSDLRANQDWK